MTVHIRATVMCLSGIAETPTVSFFEVTYPDEDPIAALNNDHIYEMVACVSQV